LAEKKAVARLCKKPLDVHLMIMQPEKFIKQVAELGAMMMNHKNRYISPRFRGGLFFLL
jgi:pentose-5-phosphate-3-epimerase